MTTTLPVITPMLASPPKKETLSTLVGTHTFDIKLDGVRCLLYWDGQTCKLVNRSGVNVTHRFPEVVEAAKDLGPRPIVLDGEIVAKSGSFQDTAKRDKQNKPMDIKQAMAAIPVTFVAFDMLWLANVDLRPMTYVTRRANLETVLIDALGLHVSNIQLSVVSTDADFFDVVKSMGMEGVIAKRNTSTYRSGRFSDWIKFKALRSITCVGIGYEVGTGARAHFGAMHLALVGHPNGGGIVEVGRVGTGFDTSEIAYLKGELDAGRPVVVEIECLNKSRDNKLRFPVYKGVRTDLSVVDAKLEQLADIPTM